MTTIVSLLILCLAAPLTQAPSQTDFPNLLSVSGTPSEPDDRTVFHFSDEGSWMGFGMTDHGPGFTGPFLHTCGQWAGSHLEFAIMGSNAEPAQIQQIYFPGRLHQAWAIGALSCSLDLIFISANTALIRSRVQNTGKAPVSFSCEWRGSLFPDFTCQADSNRLYIHGAADTVSVAWTGPGRIHTAAGHYQYQGIEKKLQPGHVKEAFVALTFWNGSGPSLTRLPFKTAFPQNCQKWDEYIARTLKTETAFQQNSTRRSIAVKALMTLLGNWRAARGDLKHGGLFPSAHVSYFNGFWAWDSWKHAAALAVIHPALAKDQIRALFDWQNDSGMIPDVIYLHQKENNWRDTKPPLAAWAVKRVFQASDDTAFVHEMMPGLLAYHAWWYARRDHNQNGLCEYGSTDGTLVAARWESGMDDGLRFDSARMVKNGPNAWSMNQESVDLNSYLYAEKNYLSHLLALLNQNAASQRFKQEADRLKHLIQQTFFDEETGFFYDVRLEDRSFVRVMGPEGWIPLTAGAATPEQAKQVITHMLDSHEFATVFPLPTIPANHPAFMSGYWRGPVWLDQAGFGLSALMRYGYNEAAGRFMRHIYDRVLGMSNSSVPIYENYDPRNGQPLKAPHFSWSAAHLLMMYWGNSTL